MPLLMVTGFQPDITNPTPAQITGALLQLPAIEPNDYLILDRDDEAYQGISHTFLQARPHRGPAYEGVFLVEHRDGLAGRHYKGHIEVARLAELFLSYFRNDDLWRELVIWRDISYQFPQLHPALEEGELASSFFPEGEWEAALKDKEKRDNEFHQLWEELNDDPK